MDVTIELGEKVVSDDDDSFLPEKKKFKYQEKLMQNSVDISDKLSTVNLDICREVIDDAENEERIDAKKAARLRELLDTESMADMVFSLICEQIPLKRKNVYKCKICEVALKGHTCRYCPLCSTCDKRNPKEGHICIYCQACFDYGKKKKKVVKILREGHDCPHKAFSWGFP